MPQLGDGRANLLGEVVGRDGVGYDVQLKGSGPTPFSRRGDGKAALGPVLREYVVSEAMAALGVPTTRALAAVVTGERILREGYAGGGVYARGGEPSAGGDVPVFCGAGRHGGIADAGGVRDGPALSGVGGDGQLVRALLEAIISRQAKLIAQWMGLGFIHGVMNTDNMAISGETIDYGPCAFMEAYEPGMVYSSIDRGGRYGYSNQPHAALWNLSRLAEALLPLLVEEQGSDEDALAAAQEALMTFEPQYQSAYLAGLRRKLGLMSERAGDAALAQDLLDKMAANHADFTLTFRRLCDAAEGQVGAGAVRELFAEPSAFDAWEVAWRRRLEVEPEFAASRGAAMRASNPVFIPRNHLVEEMIQAAVQRDDFRPFEELLTVVTHPYDESAGGELVHAACAAGRVREPDVLRRRSGTLVTTSSPP